MLFRAAAIFTTLACAVSSFAAPAGPVDTSALTNLIEGSQVLGSRQFGDGLAGTLGSLAGAAERRQLEPIDDLLHDINIDGILRRDVEHPTVPDAFQGACDQLVDIAVKLRACVDVAVGVDIDINLVVSLLGEVILVLKGLLVSLTFILQNPAGFVLSLKGEIITVAHLGLIVSTLLTTVVTVLALVVRVVDVTLHVVVGTLIAEIGVLLAQIVVVVLSLVGGLLIQITLLIGPIIADLHLLGFVKLIACLHL